MSTCTVWVSLPETVSAFMPAVITIINNDDDDNNNNNDDDKIAFQL